MKYTFHFCGERGSLDVEVTSWVYANTRQLIDGEPPLESVYCNGCHTHSRFTESAVVDLKMVRSSSGDWKLKVREE